MNGIIRKDIFIYLAYLAIVPFQILYWHITRSGLDSTIVFIMTGWINIVMLGSILGVEMNEMKNGGYMFLAALPVTARDIVRAKFAVILVISAIYGFAAWFAFAGLEAPPGYLEFARRWLLLNAATALGTAGLVYWAVFRYGLERAMYLLGGLLAFTVIVPIGLNELVIRGYLGGSSAVFRLAGTAGNLLLLAAGAAVYLAFYKLSVRAMEGDLRS
jgi:hypothetical protein